jgi:predicted HTH transcriptional regulator
MTINKPIESISEADLQALVSDGVPEGKVIEYKESLPDNSYDNKKEFLADVSSFSNAAGGHLLLGIEEEAGIPVQICGLPGIDPDAEILRLENMLRDNIEPRIPSLSMRAV